MKRILLSILSFFIFIIEIIFQILLLGVNTIKSIHFIFIMCLIKYHNRIQWMTSKNNIFTIKEIKNANI